jgi:itaconate CoA-transferase
MGMAHPSIAPYGAFQTADAKTILLSIQSDREWVNFADTVLKSPSLGIDPRFATNVARVANRNSTDEVVTAVLSQITENEAKSRLIDAGIAFASVNDMAALSRHPHLRRITVNTERGPVSYPAPAPIFVGMTRHYGDVPALGQSDVHFADTTEPEGIN